MIMYRKRQIALAVAGLLAGFVTANAHAVTVPTTTAYGALSNFDVYNASTDTYYGFEIELVGMHKSAIPTYGTPATPAVFQVPSGYVPELIETGDATNFSTILRYNGLNADGSVIHSTSPFDFNNPVATTGHACVFASGCEHFGMGYYGNPTAIHYQWLVRGTNGQLYAPGPSVQLGQAVWNVVPPADPQVQAPEVQVEVERPEVEDPADAAPRWVKVFVDKAHKNADVLHDAVDPNDAGREMQARLNGLMSGRDDVVPQGKLVDDGKGGVKEVPEKNYEWELLHDGEQPKVRAHGMAVDDVELARRFEFYQFTGSLADAAQCSGAGKARPDFCDPDKNNQFLGALVGAQMAAVNLDIVQPQAAPVPLPATLPALASACAALFAARRRRANRG